MSENVFDPSRHKLVAVDEDKQHIHVTLDELRSDMAALPVAATVSGAVAAPIENAATDRLAVAVAVASYAIQSGVQAGDYRWHGGGSDFEINGQRMDAPELIAYAKSLL